MMERLTAKSPKNNMAFLVKVKPNEQEVESPYPNTLKAILESFNRLAEYEDTDLTPEQIKGLLTLQGSKLQDYIDIGTVEEFARLKSAFNSHENEAYMTSTIGNLSIDSTGLRKAVDEINHIQKQVENWKHEAQCEHDIAVGLLKENERLKKNVDPAMEGFDFFKQRFGGVK